MSYIDIIKEKARQDLRTIVLPETKDKRTLLAASQVIKEGLAKVVLIGNQQEILDSAAALEADLKGAEIIDPANCDKLMRM